MNAIIYNGLTLNVSNLPVDDYWSFIINGAVELPSYLIVWPLLQTIGRRWTLASTMIVCGVGCVSAMFISPVVRAIGMGMSSMVAGSGLLLAPHIVKLGDYMKILPLLIMGLMALTAGICTFFLPETLGAPLPMTLEDAENFGKRQGLFTSASEQRKKRGGSQLLQSQRRDKANSLIF
ncbi:hypothetical protein OESDEN_10655 [Oesophagostomum dentatum]|uniref:Major facilitator superfamily (MFS) profile domain-containing protein n=1 Tax=Oesophagostomum dentatum TaxID=61180 RepID=A0A0B1SW29_OESDE|nr:hypothetical protein OESDEN_10655 [Oesophagostomum dentatum]